MIARLPVVASLAHVLLALPLAAGILTPGPRTDSSGQLISDPGWTFTYNSGTLGANVTPTTGNPALNGTYPEQTLLTGWGNGTTGGSLTLFTTLFPDGDQDLGSGVGTTINAYFTGTGSMTVFARDPWNTEIDGFGGLGFRVTGGDVTSMVVDILFDYALSPRPGVPTNPLSGAPSYGPYTSVTGYRAVGSGIQNDFALFYELLDQDLNSLNASLGSPTFLDNRNGFPFPTLSPAQSLSLWQDMNTNGQTNLGYGNSFGINNFNDGVTANDYVGGIRLTMTPVGGASFEAGVQFNYSIDGSSPSGNPVVVPEPAAATLALLATLLAFRRRRA